MSNKQNDHYEETKREAGEECLGCHTLPEGNPFHTCQTNNLKMNRKDKMKSKLTTNELNTDYKQKAFFLNIVEYGVGNEEFIKKHPDIRIGRIEIHHKDKEFHVAEIQFGLPSEMFEKVREALDFQECDWFQFGDIRSEDLKRNK